MKGTMAAATRAMLRRPPSVMAAMSAVMAKSVAQRGTPNEISTLSTMALTCGKVPMPKKATSTQAHAKKIAMGRHARPSPFSM